MSGPTDDEAIDGRWLLTERRGPCTWRALDLEHGRWVAAHRVDRGRTALPPQHPTLPEWLDIAEGWVFAEWIDGVPLDDGEGSWLEATIGLLDGLEVLHDAGWHHPAVDLAHVVRDGRGEIRLLGLPDPTAGARADLADLGEMVGPHLAHSASDEARELVRALDRGPEAVAEVYRQLAEPTWAEPLPADEPEPFQQWLQAESPAERRARLVREKKRARPLFAAAALILIVGAWLGRPQPAAWAERLSVPEGLEPVAAQLQADDDLRRCLADAEPGTIGAVVTVERDPARFRPARYRVEAKDPRVARCILRTTKRNDPGDVPGRWTLVLPLQTPSA